MLRSIRSLLNFVQMNALNVSLKTITIIIIIIIRKEDSFNLIFTSFITMTYELHISLKIVTGVVEFVMDLLQI